MPGMLDWLMNKVGMGSENPAGVMSTGPGQTYGPAMSRITHTPVGFSKDVRSDAQGIYDPNTGAITVNPIISGDVGRTIRHESTHALLDKPGMLDAAMSGPLMNRVAQSMPKFLGTPGVEAPSYITQNEAGMSSPMSQFTMNWSNNMRNQALAEMLKNVQHKDASAGSMLQRLSVAPIEDTTVARTQ